MHPETPSTDLVKMCTINRQRTFSVSVLLLFSLTSTFLVSLNNNQIILLSFLFLSLFLEAGGGQRNPDPVPGLAEGMLQQKH